MRFIFLILSGLVLVACGDNGVAERSPAEIAEIATTAATLRPTDPRLLDVYERSCANCHAIVESGAPLTGDVAGWDPRLRKGDDVLLESTINGFEGMPPMGLCPDCTAAEFRELIRFMSTAGD